MHHQSPTLGPTPEEAPRCFTRKGRCCGCTQLPPHHHPGTFLQFHRWRKVSGESFPVGAGPAHQFSQVGLSSDPGRHCPTRPGAQGPRLPRSALGGRGCPVRAGGLLVGQPLAQRGVPPPKRGPSQFNTGPKLTSSVLRETSTPLSSMKLQVSVNQEFISDTLGLWPSTSHCLPTSSTHGRSELLKATPTPSALKTFARCLIGRQGKASEKLTRPVKFYTQILPLEKRYLFNLLN